VRSRDTPPRACSMKRCTPLLARARRWTGRK
jgi:hypothetical protein